MLFTRIAHIISTPWFIAILCRTSWLASISSECSVDSKRQGEPFPGVHNLWSRNDAILRKLDKTWNVVQLFKATIRSQARNQTSGINGKHFPCQSLTRCSCITWRGRLLILDFKLLSLLSTIHALHRVIFGDGSLGTKICLLFTGSSAWTQCGHTIMGVTSDMR